MDCATCVKVMVASKATSTNINDGEVNTATNAVTAELESIEKNKIKNKTLSLFFHWIWPKFYLSARSVGDEENVP